MMRPEWIYAVLRKAVCNLRLAHPKLDLRTNLLEV